MNELALFAGAGGGILGGYLLGWRTVCAVEINPYCASVLCARQNDGILPPFPIWDDVRTFDGRPWRGIVDVVSGGFPCQDISCAGRGAGIDGERSGLWSEMARIIGEVRPRCAWVENSPMLTVRGIDRVLGDLAEMGYDARWGIVSAADAGAPHLRKRIWIMADDSEYGWRSRRSRRSYSGGARKRERSFQTMADAESESQRSGLCAAESCGSRRGRSGDGGCAGNMADSARIQRGREIERAVGKRTGESRESIDVSDAASEQVGVAGQSRIDRCVGNISDATEPRLERHGDGAAVAAGGQREGFSGATCGAEDSWWQFEPDVGRVAHGVAARVDRLKAIGNGQVPAVVRLAWDALGREG